MRSLALLASTMLLLLSVAGAAQACGREPRESVEVGGSRVVATYDCDVMGGSCFEACLAGLCALAEGSSVYACGDANGVWGCQRGDEVNDGTCGGTIESDTILF